MTHAVADTAGFSDAAWVEVLRAVDQTYADLIGHQRQLETQNAELEALRNLLDSILASISDTLILTTRDHRVVEASSSVCRLVDSDKDTILHGGIDSLFKVEDRDRLLRSFHEAIQHKRVETGEFALLTPGEPMPLEVHISPRLDNLGRAKGAILAGRPVGELRRAYAELEDSHKALQLAQAQLVQSEKLASLGRLLAGVAHELNNPISFVYANAHALERYATKFETYFDSVQSGASRDALIALREELKLDREVRNLRRAIDGARDGAERVRDIVADLRQLSHEGGNELEPFDLVETAQTAANWVMRGAAEAAELRFEGEATLTAMGHRGQIQQVIMNLVQNAIDALDGSKERTITITGDRCDDRVAIEVQDTGPGVPKADRAHIFDPFYTTKPVGRGTGLGLSISYKIAADNGGRLVLRDTGSGACFRLELGAA